MKMSSDGISRLKKREGCKLVAYLDQGDVWTIGYGFIAGVRQGDTMTAAECETRLVEELREYEQAVFEATSGDVTQPEFDALVSITWNIGIAGMRTSSFIKAHNRGDKAACARGMGLWKKVKGKDNQGLIRRRAGEAAQYLEAITEDPMPQVVDSPKKVISSTTVIAGGTAAVATATQIVKSVVELKDSVTGLGDWLFPAMAVVALVAIGWVIYERYQNRKRGSI